MAQTSKRGRPAGTHTFRKATSKMSVFSARSEDAPIQSAYIVKKAVDGKKSVRIEVSKATAKTATHKRKGASKGGKGIFNAVSDHPLPTPYVEKESELASAKFLKVAVS